MTSILFVKLTLSVSDYSAHTPVESIISSYTISSFLPLLLYSIFSIYFLLYPQFCSFYLSLSSTIYLSNFSSVPITLSVFLRHTSLSATKSLLLSPYHWLLLTNHSLLLLFLPCQCQFICFHISHHSILPLLISIFCRAI